MKISKVRITDNRPPGAGRKPPLERQRATRGGSVAGMTGLDHLEAIQSREAAEHDRWVADYPAELLIEVWEDLKKRAAFDRKDPEQRWVMGRRAAIGRRAMRLERGMA